MSSSSDDLRARAGRTVVLGVGNLLMGDEGVGVRVVRELGSRDLPADVDLADGGTGGLDVLFCIEGYARAIIVDAAEMGLPPGSVRAFGREGLAEAAPARDAHGLGIAHVLELGQASGTLPEDIVLVGIQVERIAPSPRLSSAGEAGLAAAVKCVEGLLSEGMGPPDAEQ